ncbi:unnamed protein product [Ixodes pacificus]
MERISPDLEMVAQRELGETPQVRKDAVAQLRALLAGAWNPAVCSLNELFRGIIVGAECSLMDPKIQIAGVVGVADLDGLHISHLLYYTPSEIRKALKLLQECYPVRVKGIYVINNPPVFQLIYAIVRLLLKPKLQKRMHVLGRDYEKLYKLVPREGLPTEYGGFMESYDYGELEATFRSKEDYFLNLGRYGYQERQALKESVGSERTDRRSAVK